MKRDRAINIISDELLEIMDSGINVHDTGKYAEIILSRLERLGMLPPERENERYNEKEAASYSSHPFLEYEEEYYINKWE